MIRLVPKSLAGQLIVLLLAALAVAQVVTIIIIVDDRREVLEEAGHQRILARTGSVARLL